MNRRRENDTIWKGLSSKEKKKKYLREEIRRDIFLALNSWYLCELI